MSLLSQCPKVCRYNANLVANGHKVMLLTTALAKANCTTAGNTAIDTLGTALTKATHQLVKSPDNSADVTGGLATNKVFTQKWYQPKESKDKTYKDKMPRWSKGDTLLYKQIKNTGKDALFACNGTGTVINLGASTLFAGAAVAFGAATLI